MPAREFLFALSLMALAGLVMFGARDIPPPIYDPLGSAAMPVIVAGVVLALAVITIAQGLRARGRAGPEPPSATQHERPWMGALFALLTIVYVASMSAGLISFQWATMLYTVAVIVLLAQARRQAALPAIIVSAIVAFGGYWLFTSFFFVALP